MAIRQTHTYAALEVSAATYDEIARLLRDAGYDHAFYKFDMAGGAPTIDMHGIGLQRSAELAAVEDGGPDGDGADEEPQADDAGGVLEQPGGEVAKA